MALFPGADPFVAAQKFWLVTYDQSEGSVESRYVQTSGSTLQGYAVISAATSSQAETDARNEGYIVSDVQGPYSSTAAATAAGTAQKQTAQKATQAGVIPGGGVAKKVATAVTKAVGAAEDAATAIPDFLSRLTSINLWIRIGEVVLGLILVAVGVAEITHAVPIATKIAKKVGAGAAIAAV